MGTSQLLVGGLEIEKGNWGLLVFAQDESDQSESWHPILIELLSHL
jgi:hypothetical protein